MSEKLSGGTKVSATSTKNGGTKWHWSMAMPTNYLPCSWKFMLALTGMLILSTGAFMVAGATVKTQRRDVDEIERTAIIVDLARIEREYRQEKPGDGDCYYKFEYRGTLDGVYLGIHQILLNKENKWKTEVKRKWREVYMVTMKSSLVFCWYVDDRYNGDKGGRCYILTPPDGNHFQSFSGRLIWQLDKNQYLDCQMSSSTWYENTVESMYTVVNLVTPENPICTYYANDATVIRLAKKNKWTNSYGDLTISMFRSDDELVLMQRIKSMKDIDIRNFRLKLVWDSESDVLGWMLTRGYFECKPATKFLEVQKTIEYIKLK